MSNRRSLPKGVWFQRKKLSSGEVVRYGYYGRGPDAAPLGREGSADFFQNLAAAMSREPEDGTLANLIYRYRQSPEFASLRARTKRDYLQQLGKIDAKFTNKKTGRSLSLKTMAAREITTAIFEWRDSMQQAPRRADYAIQVLKALLSWGVKRGHLDINRAAGVGRLYKGDRRERIWTDAQIAAFNEHAPEPLRRALTLAIETGQRQGDLLRLQWNAVRDGKILLRQSKGGNRVAVPVSHELATCLADAPRGDSTVILTTAAGLPWDAKGNGFRAAWREVCRAAGVDGVTFHDLRGTFVTRRMAAGWTTQEVALCTGHSLRDLATLETYADRGTIADASADRLRQRSSEDGK